MSLISPLSPDCRLESSANSLFDFTCAHPGMEANAKHWHVQMPTWHLRGCELGARDRYPLTH
jgi:hypothetical protein